MVNGNVISFVFGLNILQRCVGIPKKPIRELLAKCIFKLLRYFRRSPRKRSLSGKYDFRKPA